VITVATVCGGFLGTALAAVLAVVLPAGSIPAALALGAAGALVGSGLGLAAGIALERQP
jgi:hypothetical protein